mmetsp:Transcript_25610/g.64537  ORF Transcript_25610/g.64537 Transcript_25610/m.64537 type:complete len:221 (-) Transcript_25610:127-789(-)
MAGDPRRWRGGLYCNSFLVVSRRGIRCDEEQGRPLIYVVELYCGVSRLSRSHGGRRLDRIDPLCVPTAQSARAARRFVPGALDRRALDRFGADRRGALPRVRVCAGSDAESRRGPRLDQDRHTGGRHRVHDAQVAAGTVRHLPYVREFEERPRAPHDASRRARAKPAGLRGRGVPTVSRQCRRQNRGGRIGGGGSHVAFASEVQRFRPAREGSSERQVPF